MQHFDVTIIGAGMVGLALARALENTRLRIALVNRGPLSSPLSAEPELRVSAINEVNRRQFEHLGVWSALSTERFCDYKQMHVWDQDSFGRIQFNANELNVAQLGAIVENQALINALAEQVVKQANITVIENVNIQTLSLGDAQHAVVFEDGQLLSTSLVVGADGAQSQVRKTANFPLTFGEYGQAAIVATIKTQQPHGNTARQVFTPYGPLALLPLADEHLCSIVWSQDADKAHMLLALDDAEFNQQLSVASNHCLGLLSLHSERKSFVLTKQYARQWVSEGVVLCGDAAHTFHPLAGQGANLGFEDAWMLADVLINAEKQNTDLRAISTYRAYERARKTEANKMMLTMESFHQLFTGDHSVKKGFRGLGLALANSITPVKHALAKEALGL